MSSRKTTVMIIALLALSCHEAPKPESTTIYYYHDISVLHDRVKQLTEIYHGGKSNKDDTTTTDFDIHGNSIQTRTVGDEPSLFNYKYSHDKQGTKIRLAAGDANPFRYSYSFSNDRAAEMDMVTLNSDHELTQEKFLFKYDKTGNCIQEDYYSDLEHEARQMYKYDDKHLLIEEEYFYGDGKKPTMKTSYRYTSFDSKGNWLRRIGQVEDYGVVPAQVIHQPVVVRKISYY